MRIEHRDLIDNMIQGSLWDHYVAEPRFLTMLRTLTAPELEQLPDYMRERCIKVLADMDLSDRVSIDQISFVGYVWERQGALDIESLDALEPSRNREDAFVEFVEDQLMDDLDAAWAEIEGDDGADDLT